MELPYIGADTKQIANVLAGIGAASQLAISAMGIVMWVQTASFAIVFIALALAAAGGGYGVWTGNVHMAAFGTVMLFTLGLLGGPVVTIISLILALSTYLEYRHQRASSPG